MKVPHQTLEVINSVLFIVHVHHCIPAELSQISRGQTRLNDMLNLPAVRAKGNFFFF